MWRPCPSGRLSVSDLLLITEPLMGLSRNSLQNSFT